MKIDGAGFTAPIEIEPLIRFQPKTTYAVKWVDSSDGNVVGVNRGASSDVYECDVDFYGVEATLAELLQAIEDNRTVGAGENIIYLYELVENQNFFGADVDITQTVDGYANAIKCSVLDLGMRKQGSFRGFGVGMTLRALSPSFIGTATMPTLYPMIGYTGDKDNTLSILDSFTGSLSYQDRSSDAGSFSATYQLKTADMRNLRRSIATTRNGTHSIASLAGVAKPFGLRTNSYPLSVKIVKFTDGGLLSPGWWTCKIEMVEVV